MTDSEFAAFVDEITDLRDRFTAAFNTGDLNPAIGMTAGMVARRLAGLEREVGRPLPDTVVLRGRKPERHPRLPDRRPDRGEKPRQVRQV